MRYYVIFSEGREYIALNRETAELIHRALELIGDECRIEEREQAIAS
jgi:hypothetical protein